MRKALFSSLIKRLSKIYFSEGRDKNSLYKKEIYYTLKDMGGVYNKFLQVLCVTKNFMAGWSSPKEFEVYNKVPLEDIDILNLVPKKEKYSYIEKKPIATGSFAQVYKGYLKSGEVVALKVLRPSVYKNLGKDLKKLGRIVKIFSYFIDLDLLDINAAFREFSEMCLVETDYEQEMANMKYFGKIYKNNQFIVVPKVYQELSNRYLIVQEYIGGVTLADVITSLDKEESIEEKCFKLTGSNIWKQLIIVGGELIRAAMEDDFLYGDPHAGNIILLNHDKVAFIDYGILARAPLSHYAFYNWVKAYYDILNGKMNMRCFIESTCNSFCPDYINALKNCTNEVFLDAITKALLKKLDSLKLDLNVEELVKNGHIFILFTEFMDKNNALGINLDLRNFQLLKAIQAYICTIYTIDKRFKSDNFVFLMMGAMEYAFSLVKDVAYDFSSKSRFSGAEAWELLDAVLSKIAGTDEFMFNNVYREMF